MNGDSQHNSGKHFFYGLILKHCVCDINQCIQTLQWILSYQCYNPKDNKHYSNGIIKIIKQCDDVNALHRIYSLIQQIGLHNIHINMAFLHAFDKYSIAVFDDIMMVFHSVDNKDVILIGATMNVLMNHDYNSNAIAIYKQYTSLMDDICHALAIKACIKLNDFETGKEIHSKMNNEYDMKLKCTLIEFYGHFNEIGVCQHIFYALNSHQMNNVILIGAMMKMYINNNNTAKALRLYHKYGSLHNCVTNGLALKACIHCNDYEYGKIIHSKLDPTKNGRLSARLIDFYAHFNEMDTAIHIFNSFHNNEIDSAMINSMMNASITHNDPQKALDIYLRFKARSVLNEISHIFALKACKMLNDAKSGKQIINTIKIHKVNNSNLLSALIHFHGYFGKYTESFHIFNLLTENKKTTLVLNSFIAVCLQYNHYQTVLDLYDKYGDTLNIKLVIKACIKQRNLNKGIAICNKIDLNEADIHLKSTLIEFLGEFNLTHIAEDIYNSVDDNKKDSVFIGCMMKAYIINNQYINAIQIYEKHTVLQNNYLHSLGIKACIKAADFDRAKQIELKVKGDDTMDVFIETALIDLYGHLGDIDTAKYIFKTQNIVCYNAMMESYFMCGLYQETIKLFDTIFNGKNVDIVPDIISYRIALKACSESSSLHFGEKLHKHLMQNKKEQWMLSDLSIQICLINFYGKCGMLNVAQHIFIGIQDKYKLENISAWNAMIHAFGRNGESNKGYELYLQMRNEANIVPNDKTYIQVINGFTHCGDVDKANKIWQNEIDELQIKYNCYVITALISGLCRKGMVNMAVEVITEYERYHNKDTMHHEPMWLSLLNGCKMHGHDKMAENVYTQIQQRFAQQWIRPR